MSRRDKSHHHKTSSSSSSSESGEVQIKIKHHKKQPQHSSSDSEIECYSNDKHKHKKHSPKSDSEKGKKCKPHKDSSSSSSDSDHKDKCSFEEIYKYYKYRLLTDNELMVTGSNAYINSYSNSNLIIPKQYPAELEHNSLLYNVSNPYVGAPYYVREDGVYIVFFVINTDQSTQFCMFVNGKEEPLTRYGNNAGGGQLVLRNMLKLRKNDSVVIRNSVSTTPAITSNNKVGGLLTSNDMTFLLMKIAAYETPKSVNWDEKCLSKRKLYLYNKLLEKLACDKELMIKGFNIHGTFYTTTSQDVITEADVVFNTTANVNGLIWSSPNPNQVVVQEDGVYKVFFLATVLTSCQFAICVNGVPIDYTIQGINKGAAQITLRVLLELKKNDVLSVKNHTSSNGKTVLSQEAGGVNAAISAILTVFKTSPLCKPCLDVCKLNSYHKKCYEKFKAFLLHQKNLQIAGVPYIAVSSDVHQEIAVDQSYDWCNTYQKQQIKHDQGTQTFTILEDGLYDIFTDILTNEPSQLALFVNGTPDVSTIFGRESAGRCLMRQFVKLTKGDVLTVRNYESHAGTIYSGINAGGEFVAQNALFMAFRLSPNECVYPVVKPCEPVKSGDKKKK